MTVMNFVMHADLVYSKWTLHVNQITRLIKTIFVLQNFAKRIRPSIIKLLVCITSNQIIWMFIKTGNRLKLKLSTQLPICLLPITFFHPTDFRTRIISVPRFG